MQRSLQASKRSLLADSGPCTESCALCCKLACKLAGGPKIKDGDEKKTKTSLKPRFGLDFRLFDENKMEI